jgi:hypothetical protein
MHPKRAVPGCCSLEATCLNETFRSFVAVEKNWFFGPLLEVGAWYVPAVDLDRPWRALWRDEAVTGPFEDHALTVKADAAPANERYGYFTLPDGESLGFRTHVRSDPADTGWSLWLQFPPRMVSRVVSPSWYCMEPAMGRVHDPLVALLRRLHENIPFRAAGIGEESNTPWPITRALPGAVPRGAILVYETFAKTRIPVADGYITIA